MEYQIYLDAGGDWRWRLVASNGRIVSDSAEGYRNKQDLLDEIEQINKAEKIIESDPGSEE